MKILKKIGYLKAKKTVCLVNQSKISCAQAVKSTVYTPILTVIGRCLQLRATSRDTLYKFNLHLKQLKKVQFVTRD